MKNPDHRKEYECSMDFSLKALREGESSKALKLFVVRAAEVFAV